MADAPAERGTARPPTSRGREDTVAIPVPPRTAAPGRSNGSPNGRPRGDSNGQAKVLPPMPPRPTTKPPKAKAKPKTQPPTAKTNPPGPKPTAPPPTAKPVVPVAAAAAAAAVTAPAPAPSQAPTKAPAKAPAKPKVKAPRPEKQPKPPKQPRQAKPPKAKAAVAKTRPPGRRARLRLTRIDPWSVLKTSFLLSIALGIVTVVSVFMVWSVLDAADVWSSINETVQGVVGGQEASNFDIEDYIGTRRVVGFTMIVAAVDVVLLTAIATLGAFLYNMAASLLGGIEVTLAEDN